MKTKTLNIQDPMSNVQRVGTARRAVRAVLDLIHPRRKVAGVWEQRAAVIPSLSRDLGAIPQAGRWGKAEMSRQARHDRKGTRHDRWARRCSAAPLVWVAVLACVFVMSAPAAETITYTYDAAGRLTQAAYSGGASIAYAYDANGNLLTRSVSAAGGTTYTLVYLAGEGGSISGVATQEVAEGQSGSPVTAVVENVSAVFNGWSDGSEANPRTDAEVMADLTVIASFLSQGGADLDWYAARGIAPENGEDWADVDARVVAAKGTTLRHENIADTDPDDTNDVFRVLSISNGPPLTVQFQPGSTGRVYTFEYTEDLTPPTDWTPVPGVLPRPGAGGTDEMQDAGSDPARQIHYRIQVEAP